MQKREQQLPGEGERKRENCCLRRRPILFGTSEKRDKKPIVRSLLMPSGQKEERKGNPFPFSGDFLHDRQKKLFVDVSLALMEERLFFLSFFATIIIIWRVLSPHTHHRSSSSAFFIQSCRKKAAKKGGGGSPVKKQKQGRQLDDKVRNKEENGFEQEVCLCYSRCTLKRSILGSGLIMRLLLLSKQRP